MNVDWIDIKSVHEPCEIAIETYNGEITMRYCYIEQLLSEFAKIIPLFECDSDVDIYINKIDDADEKKFNMLEKELRRLIGEK